MAQRYKKQSGRPGPKLMSKDNGKKITPTGFGDLLEAALSNVVVQLETMDRRLTMVEDYIKNDIKNKAEAGRIIRGR